MSLGATAEWFGGMTIGNLFADSLGMSHLTTSASITEYWKMSDVSFDILPGVVLSKIILVA